MNRKILQILTVGGRRIDTLEDLAAVFNAEEFILKRNPISSWLRKHHQNILEKIGECKEDADWLKKLANILGCDEKYQSPPTPAPAPIEKPDSPLPAAGEPPTASAPVEAKTFKQEELFEFLKQEIDNIRVTGRLASTVYEIITADFPGDKRDLICKCLGFLESPETERENFEQALASLGFDDKGFAKQFFGYDYDEISNDAKAERILEKYTKYLFLPEAFIPYLPQLWKYKISYFALSARSKYLYLERSNDDDEIFRYPNILKKCCLLCKWFVIHRKLEVNEFGTCISYQGSSGFCRACRVYGYVCKPYREAVDPECDTFQYELWGELKTKIKEISSKY